MPGMACVVKEGMCGEGGHAWQRGGGVHGEGGVPGQRGACVTKGSMHGMHTPHAPSRDMAGQCTGGMHPTGMHACCFLHFQRFFRQLGKI